MIPKKHGRSWQSVLSLLYAQYSHFSLPVVEENILFMATIDVEAEKWARFDSESKSDLMACHI